MTDDTKTEAVGEPPKSNFANELFQRKLEQSAREYEAAEREALASGKEPFDVARLDVLLGEAPGTSAPEEAELRENYYVMHSDIRTLADYADLLKRLSLWK